MNSLMSGKEVMSRLAEEMTRLLIDKTILHLQAKVEYLEHENASKDDWCRKRDEAARKLEGTLRTKESSFEAQLARKDQELEAKIHEIRVLEAKVRNLEDQVLFDRRQVEEIKSAHSILHQEKVTRERELQEKSEELTKFLLELDAKSAGDVPSAIKGSCEASKMLRTRGSRSSWPSLRPTC